MSQDEKDTDAKNWAARNSASEITNPLEMAKKTFQAFASPNSDIRARSYSQITILSQDEKDADAKNWAARNSPNLDSELTNPLELVKNQFRLLNHSILMSELGVRLKLHFRAQMSSKKTQKI